MDDRNLKYQDLLQIVELIESSSKFSEFHLKVGDIELDLKKGLAVGHMSPETVSSPKVIAPGEPVSSSQSPRYRNQGSGEINNSELPLKPSSEHLSRGAPLAYPDGAILIKSPMVGTFYRASEPGAKPFVEVGAQVEPHTITCIIEVMKLMNSIPAGFNGMITHILVKDAEPVQYGEVLMIIEPMQSE